MTDNWLDTKLVLTGLNTTIKKYKRLKGLSLIIYYIMTSQEKVPLTVRTTIYNPFCRVPEITKKGNVHRSPYQKLYKTIWVTEDEDIEVIEQKFRKIFCLAPVYQYAGASWRPTHEDWNWHEGDILTLVYRLS